jgi:hypothetical protein
MGMTMIFACFLIRADFAICPAVNFSGYPVVTRVTDQYYAFWIDQRCSPLMAIYGARISTNGTVFDSAGVAVYTDSAGYGCSAAFDGTNFLVVTRNHC